MPTSYTLPPMDSAAIWSLRLGFSTAQAQKLRQLGISKFLDQSFEASFDQDLPDFLKSAPKSDEEYQNLLLQYGKLPASEQKSALLQLNAHINHLRIWWLQKKYHSEYPLREKTTAFWQNHFAVQSPKVRVTYWVYQLNSFIRKHALGNIKTLTLEVIQSNAMLKYLDNNQNTVTKPNENLSRELLELFTMGIGNYSEEDVKNGAKILSGLQTGIEKGAYDSRLQHQGKVLFLDKKVSDLASMVEAIFQKPVTAEFLTRKILKWFLYDVPPEDKVKNYASLMIRHNYELRPFLKTVFEKEYPIAPAGSQIKDPLTFIFQLLKDLNLKYPDWKNLLPFLRGQGYELFNPPSVQGFLGGNYWLTSQTLMHRNQVAIALCNNRGPYLFENDRETLFLIYQGKTADEIAAEFSQRLISYVTPELVEQTQQIMPYDFSLKANKAHQTVLKTYISLVTSAEFQIL